MKLTIPGELPGLNEIIAAAKEHFGAYSAMKHEYTGLVALLVRRFNKFDCPVTLNLTWYAQNKRVDPDNLAGGGTKFILDGLVQARVIPNDTWQYIKGISHKFKLDRQNPRVEIEIEEVKE